MCYENGGIVDDLLVYNMGGHYMLVINASNTAKDLEWMRRHVQGDVRITDVSDSTSLLAIQGPRSLDTLRKLTRVNLESLQYYHYVRGDVAGVAAIISRTGYTGELGFEIYFPGERALGEKVWDALMESGKPFGIGPAGLGARDTLRLEMGYCLYGHDIDQTTNPIEAGLGWITKADKGVFLGRDPIAAMVQRGPARKLVGFTSPDRLVPRQGYAIRRRRETGGDRDLRNVLPVAAAEHRDGIRRGRIHGSRVAPRGARAGQGGPGDGDHPAIPEEVACTSTFTWPPSWSTSRG